MGSLSMKRDMDLIRLLLLELEQDQDVNLSGYSQEQIGYHKYLLIKGGLVEGANMTGVNSEHYEGIVVGLTWEGHEFLDNAKNEKVWSKLKRELADKGTDVSFHVLKSLLAKLMLDFITKSP